MSTPSTGNGRIAYLNWDENGRIQLYATDINQPFRPEQLTDVTGNVDSYAVTPNGSQVVYAVRYENGRSELWQLALKRHLLSGSLKMLLTCENALCSQPVWAPDGRRLIYEKRELLDNGEAGPPVLWWLDVNTGETITVLEDARPPNQGAAISPDGKWLSYAAPADAGTYVYNLENGRFFHIFSQMKDPASWNTGSNQLIIADYNVVIFDEGAETNHQEHDDEAAQSIHLFVADVDTETRHQLTEGSSVDDGTPVWSPDGQWIAFGRKLMYTNTGRQLWLVRTDGSEAIPLTNDLTLHHGVPSWSQDGRHLLFQQFNTNTPDTPPTIRIIDIQTQEQQEIVPVGFQPTWLP